MKPITTHLKFSLALSTLALTLAACSAGTLPSELTASSSAPVVAPTQLDTTPATLTLIPSANPSSIKVGGSTTISVSGGALTSVYTYAVDNVALGSMSGNSFTAASIGTVTITIVETITQAKAQIQVGITAADLPIPPTTLLKRFSFLSAVGLMDRKYTTSQPSGYSDDNVVLRVLQTAGDGRVPLTGCVDLNFQTFYTTSTCPGTTGPTADQTPLGYLYSLPGAGRIAVHRFIGSYASPYVISAYTNQPVQMPDRLMHSDAYPAPGGVYVDDTLLGYAPTK